MVTGCRLTSIGTHIEVSETEIEIDRDGWGGGGRERGRVMKREGGRERKGSERRREE
jgi:hypothetical protein